MCVCVVYVFWECLSFGAFCHTISSESQSSVCDYYLVTVPGNLPSSAAAISLQMTERQRVWTVKQRHQVAIRFPLLLLDVRSIFAITLGNNMAVNASHEESPSRPLLGS